MDFFHLLLYLLRLSYDTPVVGLLRLKGPISKNTALNSPPFHLPPIQRGSFGSAFPFWPGSYPLAYLIDYCHFPHSNFSTS